MPRKTKQRIAEIDKFIALNYPLHGARFCADALKESVEYIRIRAGCKKITRLDDKSVTTAYLKGLNKALRLENIRLIMEKRRLQSIV